MSKFGAIAIAVIAGAVGFGAATYLGPQISQPKFVVPIDVDRGRAVVTSGTSLGCKAIADAMLVEKLVGEKNVEAFGKAGTDTASIKVSDEGRSIIMLTGASLRGGATQGIAMPIIETTPGFIVAQHIGWPSYETVVIDIHTGNVVWTDAGYIVGMGTEAIYFRCD